MTTQRQEGELRGTVMASNAHSKAVGISISGALGAGVAVLGDPFRAGRPKDFDEVYIIEWEDIGLVIPWPEGLTEAEAVQAWRVA